MIRKHAKNIFYSKFPQWALRRTGRSGDRVWLTFDDGPHAQNTPRLLDLFAEQGVAASFFVVGEEARQRPALVQRMAREGHAVAAHSWDHAEFSQLDLVGMWRDLARTQRAIVDCGAPPTNIYRPPYGRLTVPLLGLALARQLRVALWSIDSKDDASQSRERVVQRCRDARGGDILLFHDDNTAALEALPELIRILRDQGLGFATIDEAW